MACNAWTEEEIEILKKEYPANGVCIPILSKRHSYDAIRVKAHIIGVKYTYNAKNFDKKCKWTGKELEVLEKEYPKYGSKIPELLKRHTVKEILTKARSKNLTCSTSHSHVHDWTEEEIEILKKEYPKKGVNIPELLINHTTQAIRTRASRIKCGFVDKRNPWTEEEIEVLKREYPLKGNDIPELFNNHPPKLISTKASQLYLKAPLKTVEGFDGVSYISIKDMCRHFGVSYNIYKSRIQRGWNQKYALIIPPLKYHSFKHKNIAIAYVTCSKGVPYFKCKCNLCGLEKILSFDEIEAHTDTCGKKEGLE